MARTPIEKNRLAAIGATIFFTAIIAGLSSAYAFNYIFDSTIITVGAAILWALMIFNLDRFIILSMTYSEGSISKLTQAIPRICLAVIIALVIAKPFELKIFESEIEKEILAMDSEYKIEREQFIYNRYSPIQSELENEILILDKSLNLSKSYADSLQLLATQEADGTGGSMQKNLGPIYALKNENANNAKLEYKELKNTLLPKKDSLNQLKANLIAERNQKLSENDQLFFDGLSTRLDALSRIGLKKHSIRYTGWFIMFLLIAIELAPIFTKLLSGNRPYDYVLDSEEEQFKTDHKIAKEKERLRLKQAIV